MAARRIELELAAPTDVVFAVLCDIEGWTDWDPSIRAAVAREETTPAVGSRYDVTIGFYGKAIEQVHELVVIEVPTRLVVETTGRASGTWMFDLTALEAGTHLCWQTTLRLRGLARVLDRGLDLALGGLVDNAADGLKTQLG